MDIYDRASEREAEHREDAIEAQRRRTSAADTTRWDELSKKWCAGCGQRIPDGRRKAVPGVQLCIECQEDADRLEGGR